MRARVIRTIRSRARASKGEVARRFVVSFHQKLHHTLFLNASFNPSSCLLCALGVRDSSLTPYAASSNALSPRPLFAEASAAARNAALRASFCLCASSKSTARAEDATDADANATAIAIDALRVIAGVADASAGAGAAWSRAEDARGIVIFIDDKRRARDARADGARADDGAARGERDIASVISNGGDESVRRAGVRGRARGRMKDDDVEGAPSRDAALGAACAAHGDDGRGEVVWVRRLRRRWRARHVARRVRGGAWRESRWNDDDSGFSSATNARAVCASEPHTIAERLWRCGWVPLVVIGGERVRFSRARGVVDGCVDADVRLEPNRRRRRRLFGVQIERDHRRAHDDGSLDVE